MVEALDESRRTLTAAQDPEMQEDPQVNRLKARIKVQEQQRQAREKLLSINHELQIQLTTALEDEIVARADLERKLELAEAELRTIRADLDFPSLRENHTQVKPSSSRKDRPSRLEQTRPESKGSRNDRLSALSKQLKDKALSQNDQAELEQVQTKDVETKTLNKRKSTKSDQKRLRNLADRLKSQHPANDAEAPVRAAVQQ